MPSKKPTIKAYVDENEHRKIRWMAKRQGVSMSKLFSLQALHHKAESTCPDLTKVKNIHARINQRGEELKSALEKGNNAAINEILAELGNVLPELGKEVIRIGTNNLS